MFIVNALRPTDYVAVIVWDVMTIYGIYDTVGKIFVAGQRAVSQDFLLCAESDRVDVLWQNRGQSTKTSAKSQKVKEE
jgi:hypothetical protein